MLPGFILLNVFLGLLKPLVPLRCKGLALWPNHRVAGESWEGFEVCGLCVHCERSKCEVNTSMGGDVNVLLECYVDVE